MKRQGQGQEQTCTSAWSFSLESTISTGSQSLTAPSRGPRNGSTGGSGSGVRLGSDGSSPLPSSSLPSMIKHSVTLLTLLIFSIVCLLGAFTFRRASLPPNLGIKGSEVFGLEDDDAELFLTQTSVSVPVPVLVIEEDDI